MFSSSEVTTKAYRQVSIPCDVLNSWMNATSSSSSSSSTMLLPPSASGDLHHRRSSLSPTQVQSVQWWCSKCVSPELLSLQDSSASLSPSGHHKIAETRLHNSATSSSSSSSSTASGSYSDRIRILPGELSLSLNPVLLQDSGEYYCVVVMQANNANAVKGSGVQLRVQDVPGTPGRPLVMESSSRSANLSWAAPASNGNSQILKYIIFIRELQMGGGGTTASSAAFKEDESVVVPAHGGKEESFQVGGLRPFTVYSFRVAASNSLGDSAASEPSFETVTLREVPSGKPVITAAQNTSATSVRVDWAPPTPDSLHGEFLGYRLSYKPRDAAGNWPVSSEARTVEIPSPNTTATAFTAATFSSQLVAVKKAVDENGLEDLKATLGIYDTLISRILKGKLGYNNSKICRKGASSFERRSFTIRNLLPYTQYLVSLEVFNPEGVGPPTTVMVMTDEGVPSKPRNVLVVKETSDSVKLSWQPPETPNGELRGYRLYFMRDNFTDVRSIHNTSSAAKSVDYVLDRLQPSSKYKVWLKAFTYKNEGDPSDAVWVHTSAPVPGQRAGGVGSLGEEPDVDPGSNRKHLQQLGDDELEPLELLELTCDPELGSIYLHWRQPPSAAVRLDHFYIVVEDTGSGLKQEFRVKASSSTDSHEHKLMLRNLSLPYMERVVIKAAAKSPPHSDRVRFGAAVERSIDDLPPPSTSSSTSSTVRSDSGARVAPCRSSRSLGARVGSSSTATTSLSARAQLANASKMTLMLLIGAVVCSSIMLVLLTISAFMYRRYFRRTSGKQSQRRQPLIRYSPMPDDWWGDQQASNGNSTSSNGKSSSSPSGNDNNAGNTPLLSVASLSNHIHNLRTEGNAALKAEFQTIKAGANPCRSVLELNSGSGSGSTGSGSKSGSRSGNKRGRKRYKGVYLDGWREKQGFLVIPRPAVPSASASYVPSDAAFWALVDTVAASLVVQFKVAADEFIDDEQELAEALRGRPMPHVTNSSSDSSGKSHHHGQHHHQHHHHHRNSLCWEKISEEEEEGSSWSRRVFVCRSSSNEGASVCFGAAADEESGGGSLHPPPQPEQKYLEIWRFNLCDSDHDLSSRFAKFVVRSLHAVLSLSGPTVIHCSPGASQAAGSFVALCALLRQVAATGAMSVMAFCKYLRHADPLLLQDDDQYAFIHDALHMALQQEKFLTSMRGLQHAAGDEGLQQQQQQQHHQQQQYALLHHPHLQQQQQQQQVMLPAFHNMPPMQQLHGGAGSLFGHHQLEDYGAIRPVVQLSSFQQHYLRDGAVAAVVSLAAPAIGGVAPPDVIL
ncbi:unnamed protein product [Notodromas monacha]|uniref:protein-tyrosine-phosphatase n=1 Tax=Notodromas monacha TaxID=399045 RepID=A0A7R9BRZ5_9CRUS|nr:unnamed protein product [Notodromas monacha]CAG0920596.1 unnamed protein product [Notodromas monacha]